MSLSRSFLVIIVALFLISTPLTQCSSSSSTIVVPASSGSSVVVPANGTSSGAPVASGSSSSAPVVPASSAASAPASAASSAAVSPASSAASAPASAASAASSAAVAPGSSASTITHASSSAAVTPLSSSAAAAAGSSSAAVAPASSSAAVAPASSAAPGAVSSSTGAIVVPTSSAASSAPVVGLSSVSHSSSAPVVALSSALSSAGPIPTPSSSAAGSLSSAPVVGSSVPVVGLSSSTAGGVIPPPPVSAASSASSAGSSAAHSSSAAVNVIGTCGFTYIAVPTYVNMTTINVNASIMYNLYEPIFTNINGAIDTCFSVISINGFRNVVFNNTVIESAVITGLNPNYVANGADQLCFQSPFFTAAGINYLVNTTAYVDATFHSVTIELNTTNTGSTANSAAAMSFESYTDTAPRQNPIVQFTLNQNCISPITYSSSAGQQTTSGAFNDKSTAYLLSLIIAISSAFLMLAA